MLEDSSIIDAKEDQHAPVFGQVKLTDLKKRWDLHSARSRSKQSKTIAPIQSVALVGAVRNKNGSFNCRDEVMCDIVMQNLVSSVSLAQNYNVDVYNLAECTDIFKAQKNYDVIIFCNLREPLPELVNYYRNAKAAGVVEELVEMERDVIPVKSQSLGRIMADALTPSDIISGIKWSNIPEEHKYYVTISPEAFEDDAYENLAKRLGVRFVSCWGFVQFIDGDYIASSTAYDLSQPKGDRLEDKHGYSPTEIPGCAPKACRDYLLASRHKLNAAKLIPNTPIINFVVRNDVLEEIAQEVTTKANPFFARGIETLEKLELLAALKVRHGRKPVVQTSEADWVSLDKLKAKLAQGPNLLVKAERRIRGLFAPSGH